MKRVVITTGDQDGIGPEISIKAMSKIGPTKNIQYLMFLPPRLVRSKIGRFQTKRFKNLKDALQVSDPKTLALIVTNKNPALCFEEAVRFAKIKQIEAIVTAPLSKKTIARSGLKDAGHTDILKRLVPTKKPLVMTFLGHKFSLVLVTDHIPLKHVSKNVTSLHVFECIRAANLMLNRNQRIGVLGLNPHAGEIGKLGDEETKIILPAIRRAQRMNIRVEGPLVPDVAFQPQNISRFSVYVAMYHEQGLIPFKMLHKNLSGIQITTNLPFVRTSVDHGTAKDIFGKNQADPSSMLMAIRKAIDFLALKK